MQLETRKASMKFGLLRPRPPLCRTKGFRRPRSGGLDLTDNYVGYGGELLLLQVDSAKNSSGDPV